MKVQTLIVVGDSEKKTKKRKRSFFHELNLLSNQARRKIYMA